MTFGKGDVVHTVTKYYDGFNVIGIVVYVDYKKRLYAVCIDTKRKDGTFWYNEKEVF